MRSTSAPCGWAEKLSVFDLGLRSVRFWQTSDSRLAIGGQLWGGRGFVSFAVRLSRRAGLRSAGRAGRFPKLSHANM